MKDSNSLKPSKEPPRFEPCPFCSKPAEPYRLADYGMVRCWNCGVRMERKGGLEVAALFWNRRGGVAVEVPPSLIEPVPAPQFETDSLAAYITAQVGGKWYIGNRPVARRDQLGEKRIKQSDYDKYEKMFQMRGLNDKT